MVQGFRAYRFRAATCFQQPRAKEPTVISETLLGNKPTVTEGPNTKPQVLGPTSCLDPHLPSMRPSWTPQEKYFKGSVAGVRGVAGLLTPEIRDRKPCF